VQMHWPFMRDAGTWGTQIIEPIAQIIGSPNGSGYNRQTRVPNEDSLDYEFTDANLFSLNHFPGIDRLEGGPRAQAARAMARNLADFDLPMLMWDERWSTRAAERAMIDLDMSRARRAERIDAHAAALILQGAIDALSGALF